MSILKIKPYYKVTIAVLMATLSLRCTDLLVWDGDPEPTVNVLSAEDSTAVRAILDANGLHDIGVREVISLQNSSVGGIKVDSLDITEFVFTNALDAFVGGFSVDIIACPVETLIIRDTIHINLTIGIGGTNLRAIPDNISLFKGSMYMYLANNRIQYISPAIMQCDIGFFDIQSNRLCSVPDTIINWILSKRPNTKYWQTTQNCELTLLSSFTPSPKEPTCSPRNLDYFPLTGF
jgi:hypothetical protein